MLEEFYFPFKRDPSSSLSPPRKSAIIIIPFQFPPFPLLTRFNNIHDTNFLLLFIFSILDPRPLSTIISSELVIRKGTTGTTGP